MNPVTPVRTTVAKTTASAVATALAAMDTVPTSSVALISDCARQTHGRNETESAQRDNRHAADGEHGENHAHRAQQRRIRVARAAEPPESGVASSASAAP